MARRSPIASVPAPGDLRTGSNKHGPKKVPPGHVRLKSPRPALVVFRPLGPMKPRVISGYGGWNLTARPRDIALTDWIGREPLRVQFQIFFDAHFKNANFRTGVDKPFAKRLSVERDCRTLEKMAGVVPDSPEPPKLIMDGGKAIPHDHPQAPHVHWVIEVLDWDDEMEEKNDRGGRTRAVATVTMLQYVKDERIPRLTAAHRRKQIKNKKGKHTKGAFITSDVIISAREGDTLVKIATRELGNARLWHELAKLNKIRDGRKVIKKGKKIKIIDV